MDCFLVGYENIRWLNGTFTILNVNFARGINYGPTPNPPEPAFIEAILRLQDIITTQYPWIDTAINFPRELPSELTDQTIGEWILDQNVTVLSPLIFREYVASSGLDLGNYDQVPVLYLLLSMGLSNLLSNLESNLVFEINHGCITWYEAMAASLGEDGVVNNAHITSITRPTCVDCDEKVVIRGYIKDGLTRTPFLQETDYLWIAIPPMDICDIMECTVEERSLYNSVLARTYATAAVSSGGTIAGLGALEVFNYDPSAPFSVPYLPGPMVLGRVNQDGPLQAPSTFLGHPSAARMRRVIQRRLNNLPSPLFEDAVIDAFFDHHPYQPHWPTEMLKENPCPQVRLDNIQGDQGTYTIGALRTFADTTKITNHYMITINTFLRVVRGIVGHQ